MEPNALYYGDCLEWMQKWDDQSVDLIYLDPPFNSKANYNQLFHTDGGGDAQYRAFSDTWVWDSVAEERLQKYLNASGLGAHDAICGLYRILSPCGMLAYLTYMAERLEHCRRLLKETGSIYLHCDPTASHYLKLVMDAIFGNKNFRNEITWQRHSSLAKGSQHAPKTWGNTTDTILFYAGSKAQLRPYRPMTESERLLQFPLVDATGRRYYDDSSHIWSSPNMGARPNLCYEWKGFKNPHPSGWRLSKERLEEEYKKGNFVIKENGKLQRRKYEHDYRGKQAGNLWNDILIPSGKERTGYPTQKPLALLRRIIEASSDEGNVVLDPFCGCGTTVEAAKNLNRQFVGIDISSFAIDLVRTKRLQDNDIPVKGIPFDLRSAEKLAKDNAFNFESWAVTRLPGFVPNVKQTGDGGIDGRATIANKPKNWENKLALAQVKSGKFSLGNLRDFMHVINRDRAAMGCFVTLHSVDSHNIRKEIAIASTVHVDNYDFPRMQIWSIEDYFEKRPPRLPMMNDPYTGKSMIPQLF